MELFLSIHSLKNFSQAWLKGLACVWEYLPCLMPYLQYRYFTGLLFFSKWVDHDGGYTKSVTLGGRTEFYRFCLRKKWLRYGLVDGNLSILPSPSGCFWICYYYNILSPIQSICPCHDDRVLASCHGKKAILWVVISRQAKHVRVMLLLPFTSM